MCSGRVDPVMVISAFLAGADGVMLAACLPGECHYTSGNTHAEARMEVVRHLLAHIGLSPERLWFRMVSSAEGPPFARYVTLYQEEIRKLGRLGRAAEEGLDDEELRLRLTAALRAVRSKKLRWVLGKQIEFGEKGNLYGERFTRHELSRLFREIIIDEYTIQEILLRLTRQPMPAVDLAERLGVSPQRVVRQLAEMKHLGLVRPNGAGIDRRKGPLWAVTEKGTERATEKTSDGNASG